MRFISWTLAHNGYDLPSRWHILSEHWSGVTACGARTPPLSEVTIVDRDPQEMLSDPRACAVCARLAIKIAMRSHVSRSDSPIVTKV